MAARPPQRRPTGTKAAVRARWLRFVQEYLIDLQGGKAYQRAGFAATGNSAEVSAARLLKKPLVKTLLEEEIAKRATRVGITADQVLDELRCVGTSDLRKAASWGPAGLILHPSETLDNDTARAIREVRSHVEEVTRIAEDGTPVTTRTARVGIILHSKVEALDKLGKHFRLFVEQHEHSGNRGGPITVEEAMAPEERAARIAYFLAKREQSS